MHTREKLAEIMPHLFGTIPLLNHSAVDNSCQPVVGVSSKIGKVVLMGDTQTGAQSKNF